MQKRRKKNEKCNGQIKSEVIHARQVHGGHWVRFFFFLLLHRSLLGKNILTLLLWKSLIRFFLIFFYSLYYLCVDILCFFFFSCRRKTFVATTTSVHTQAILTPMETAQFAADRRFELLCFVFSSAITSLVWAALCIYPNNNTPCISTSAFL